MRRRLLSTLCLVAVAAAGLSACSGDGEASTTVAEARVVRAQQQVDQAQQQVTTAEAAFCASSAAYVTALDRYGDILDRTAVTVGDVTTAGRDLQSPSEAAVEAADGVRTAAEGLAAAEAELAAAQLSLSALQSPAAAASGASSKPPAATSPAPEATPASMTAVTQAEQQYQQALRGITDSTPLRQASQQFNAAVVALETAWLQVFSDAGCLSEAQQTSAVDAVAEYTAALQQALTGAGYYTGKIDGIYSPATVDAIEALQRAHGLPVTGTMDKATQAALEGELAVKGGAATRQATADIAALQQTLKVLGYWDGPVDGVWTPALTEALERAQTALGVPATGSVDAATLHAFQDKAAKASAQPTPAPTVTTTATVTATTTTTPTPTSTSSP